MVSVNSSDIDEAQIKNYYIVAETKGNTVHVFIELPFSSMPLLSSSLEMIYYDIRIFHREFDKRYIRRIFLWDYTEDCDYTTMNRLPVK